MRTIVRHAEQRCHDYGDWPMIAYPIPEYSYIRIARPIDTATADITDGALWQGVIPAGAVGQIFEHDVQHAHYESELPPYPYMVCFFPDDWDPTASDGSESLVEALVYIEHDNIAEVVRPRGRQADCGWSMPKYKGRYVS
jgi:hypothetical protein